MTTLTMEVLPDNREVLAMISGHWPAARTRRAGCVTIEIGLSPARRPRMTRSASSPTVATRGRAAGPGAEAAALVAIGR